MYGVFFEGIGVGWGRVGGEISFVSIVGTMGIGVITSGLSLIFFVHVSRIETKFATCTKKINDNPPVIPLVPMVSTIETNEISPPPPHPNPNTQKTPHTSYIAALGKLDSDPKMAHI